MIPLLAGALVGGYLPGAILFRLPILDRARRAALDPAERAFWAVAVSLALSLAIALVLAALGRFSLTRVLAADAAIAAAAALGGRRAILRLEGAARLDAWSAAPVALALLAVWSFTPPAEYVLGGKDPGVYMNAGVQIAQRGALVIDDRLVASLPAETRGLFFPLHRGQPYYSNRFMGFFLLDPDAGTVIDQFPHLFPVAVAIGYELAGLTGARHAATACAVIGVLALYFLGSRLLGRPAGAAAAALLAMHLVQVWHARIPNSEVLAQGLVLAGLLALARAHQDDDPFFGPVAALLLGLLPFARFDGLLVIALAGAGLAVHWLAGGRVLWAFVAPLGAAGLAFLAYLLTWLAPYAVLPGIWVRHNRLALAALAVAGLAALAIGLRLRQEPRFTAALRRWLPHALSAAVIVLAAYAWFLRSPEGKLALHDAHALRMFAWYVHPAAIVAALAGLALVAPRLMWRDPAFFAVACGTAIFVFYRIRIVPEHFWATRRYLPVVLPAALIFVAAAALLPMARGTGRLRVALRRGLGVAVLGLLGWTFWSATARIRPHVEYAGGIARLEALAARFSPDDLVVVESRNASDLHVLALPLAYIYDRSVLVLATPKPDKAAFEVLLAWAEGRYRGVYFIGGGGTDLLSEKVAVTPVASDRFQIPEYESLRNAYPTHVRHKEFDFGIYRFVSGAAAAGPVVFDIGEQDDLQVVRFHAKERDQRGTYRWTRALSYLSVVGLPADARELVLWMDNGGRPSTAPPAEVELFLGETSLGRVTVGPGLRAYALPIAADLAARSASASGTVTIRLRSTTWNPRKTLGAGDDRDLGVMVDRMEIRRQQP